MAGNNINTVAITGNLTRDPELRQTPTGTSVCTLRVACNGSRKDQSGEWVDDPNYFDVIVWGRQGETAAQYLAKGRPVAVQGRLNWREWEAKEGGGHRQTVEIVAERVQFLGDKEGGNRGEQAPARSDVPADPPSGGGGASSSRHDDDIPF